MGDKGSSSRRKSSKKKSSKLSSKVLKKKTSSRNESNRHIVSKRISSSKQSCRAYSVSSSSDDFSSTSASDSLSTLVMCKRGKVQHGSVISSKSRKKGSLKKIDSAPDNTQNRKRKRSTQGHVKSRKKASKHSTRSDSEDCSTYSGRSNSSSSNGKHQKSKEAVNKEIAVSRGRRVKRNHRNRKIRSPSSSSCSRYGDHVISIDGNEKALDAVNNSRRLKSVIAVSNQHLDEIENRWGMDSHKEEMEFEELAEPLKSDNHGHDQYGAGDSQPNEVPLKVSENEEETNTSVANKSKDGVETDDLESILRLKALENLKRYRGGFRGGPTTIPPVIENEIGGESLTGMADVIPNKPTKIISFDTREFNLINKSEVTRDSCQLTEAAIHSDGEHVPAYGVDKQKVNTLPNDIAIKDKITKTPTVIVKPIPASNTNQGAGSTNPCESTAEKMPTSGDPSLKVQQREANDGSEFEQKTMSVMRGGEMVQVSYKVYIPKRTPAVAKRQLRR